MKVLHSTLQELIPGLKATPREVGHVLTMNGFMLDGFQEVSRGRKKDWVLSLEIRQNRPDMLGAIGVAYEVAAAYGLKVKLPRAKVAYTGQAPAVRIDAKHAVRRASVLGIEGVHNGPSPEWLKEFVELSGMNSVNLLVDLSNYGMLYTGLPNHLFDVEKMKGPLVWGHNKKFDRLTTLAGTELELKKKEELLIHDDQNALATMMVGSRVAEVGPHTTRLLAEVAVYDPAQVRSDSRTYHVATEASQRLGKELDPNGTRYALELLAGLVVAHAGGKVSSKLFDFYPKPRRAKSIMFDPTWPSRYGGIDIPTPRVLRILKNLRFAVKVGSRNWQVTAPTDRTDIELPEDIVEEVVRLNGYENIPAARLPALAPVADITPQHLRIADQLRELAIGAGLNEVRLLPMTTPELNSNTNFEHWDPIATQNSINEEFPVMRQSIAAGLLPQAVILARRNIRQLRLFEVGKVFGHHGSNWAEHDACGIFLRSADNRSVAELQAIVERLLRSLGITGARYEPRQSSPAVFHPDSAWDICVGKIRLGVLAKLKPLRLTGNSALDSAAYAELDVEALTECAVGDLSAAVVELTQKLVVLDQNVMVSDRAAGDKVLETARHAIGAEHLWSLEVVDVFQTARGLQLTLRVSYRGLSDQQAKDLHQKVFSK